MPETDGVDQYEEVAAELLSNIFGITRFAISDISTLSDFSLSCMPGGFDYDMMSYEELCDYTDTLMFDKIFKTYGILTSPNMTILEVCRLICHPAATVH